MRRDETTRKGKNGTGRKGKEEPTGKEGIGKKKAEKEEMRREGENGEEREKGRTTREEKIRDRKRWDGQKRESKEERAM